MTAHFIVLSDKPTDPEAFDRHYQEVHIPLGRQMPKLRRYTLGRGVTAVRGGRSYYCVAELEWDSMDDLRAAFASPQGRATADDVANLQQFAQVYSMTYTSEEVM